MTILVRALKLQDRTQADGFAGVDIARLDIEELDAEELDTEGLDNDVSLLDNSGRILPLYVFSNVCTV